MRQYDGEIIEAKNKRIAELEAELRMVDEALARRPALADYADRYSKISHACATASKSDKLEQELAAKDETIAYEQERNANNVLCASVEIAELREGLRKLLSHFIVQPTEMMEGPKRPSLKVKLMHSIDAVPDFEAANKLLEGK